MTAMTAQMWDRAESVSFDALVGLAMKIIETPRPQPPAWMIAPNFREENPRPIVVQRETAPAEDLTPYRSIRDVPRFS